MDAFLVGLMTRFSGPMGYALLGVCAFFENVIPPIPGDTVTVFGGYLAGTGRLSLQGVIAVTTAGSFAGFMTMYALGRRLGKAFFLEGRRSLFPPHAFARASAWFERFGYAVVLANRFFSGARSVISICAGMAKLSWTRVSLLSLVSCFVWNSLLIFGGFKVGENWGAIMEYLKNYNILAACLLGLAVIAWVLVHLYRKRLRRK